MDCHVCGRPATDRHHIFHGPNRHVSERYGMTVMLCRDCHLGTKGVHGRDGHALDELLKREGQSRFEKKYSREEFMRAFGRSYI